MVSTVLQKLIDSGRFERIPATFSTFFFEQIKDWNTLFPAEQSYFERLFTLIGKLPPEDFEELFSPLRALEPKMGVNEKNWPRRSFQLDQVDFLNRNARYAEWRAEIAKIFSRLDPVLEEDIRRHGRPRLAIVLSPGELPVGPDRLWTRLKGRRVALDAPIDSAVHFAPLLALGDPAPYERWLVQAATALTTPAGVVSLDYDALGAYRQRLMYEVAQIVDKEQIRGPRELGARLRKMKILAAEGAVASDVVLAEFTRAILLAGNGTLLINNTFVEWATVQAIRRARPSLIMSAFGVRNKMKPFSSLLIYADQDKTNPIPTQVDTLGTYVDLEVFYQYIWQEFEKYAEYQRNTVHIFAAEAMDEVLVIAPPDFSLPSKTSPEKLSRGCAGVDAFVRRRDLLLSALAAPKKLSRFSDVTAHVFGTTPSFRGQLSKGIPYWRSVLDVACGTDVFGSQGIAVGDIDNDGRDEIYVCQSGGLPNRLYKIRNDGVADDLTERSGLGILDDTSSALFFDTRNRGVQDLIVLRSTGPLLFLNQGGYRFEMVPDAFRFERKPQGSFTGMAAADYDGDGYVDLYLCCYIYYQSENQYRYPSPYHDARNGPPNFLFRNTGATFVDVTQTSGIDENNNRYSFAPAWCDFDADGRPELYVANDFGRKNLYKYDGKRFRDIAAEAGVEDIGPGMSAAWFDYDGDGLFDLYVANMYTDVGQRTVREKKLEPAEAYRRHSKGNSLYRNLGNGRFDETRQAEMGRWAWSADACDFDNDGAPEIYVACGMITGDRSHDLHEFFWDKVVSQTGRDYEEGWNSINQRIREGDSWNGHEANVFYAIRRDAYTDESDTSGLAFADDSRAFAFTDFDGDGNVDILLKSRLAPQVRALRNERGAGKPVFALRLRGTESNRDAIGAVVRVGRQTKQVTAGSGYLSQHTKTLYFAATATVAEVRWPSGRTQRISGLAPGFEYSITEGESRFSRSEFRPRASMRDGVVSVVNVPATKSFRLLEPLPFPEIVRGERARTILGKYLRDLRRELPPNAQFLTDKEGRLTAVQIGDSLPPATLPFPGKWVTTPGRNLAKLGAAFYIEKMPDAALVYLNDALALAPNADAANGLGLMFARESRFKEAREWFQKAIELQRDHAGAINNLGVLYGEQRQYNDAISAFEYGIRVAPDDDTLYLNLGRIYVQRGERDRARNVMERLLERKPDSQRARRAIEELR